MAKSEILAIRVTPEEKKAISDQAWKARKSMTQYIVDLATEQAGRDNTMTPLTPGQLQLAIDKMRQCTIEQINSYAHCKTDKGFAYADGAVNAYIRALDLLRQYDITTELMDRQKDAKENQP